MGTRSLTYVHDDDDKQTVLVCIYRQMDGYPSGLGIEHAEFLKPFTIINGIGGGQSVLGKFANGMGCLAAQLIAHMKDSVGSIYLYPVDTTDAGSEFHYHIKKKDGRIQLEVIEVVSGKMKGKEYISFKTPKLKTIFKGTPEEVEKAIVKDGADGE